VKPPRLAAVPGRSALGWPMSPSHRYPQGNVLYRALDRDLPLIVRGEGCSLFDEDGKRYLDACGGAFVASLGHGVRELGEAIAEQVAKVAYVNGTAFTNEPCEALSAELVTLVPRGLDHAFFLSSGSEAVEAALKLARQHFVESGRPEKHKFIACTPGYHGNTLLALSVSAREHYRAAFGPYLVPVRMIPAPYPYRGEPRDPASSAQALEQALLEEDPRTVAAFIAEPVGGTSTGASVPPREHYRRVREVCDRHEVLFVADEVLCGSGRTGFFAALEDFGVTPDIMTLGKGLSGGYVPLSAVLVNERVMRPIASGSRAVKHAQTFSHTPTICAVGLAALRYLKAHRLVERCARMGILLAEKLGALRALPAVGDVRGKGLLAGIEFVADKATKAPFPRALRFAETFTACALEVGLVVWPGVGQAGGEGDLVMLAPPFIISPAEIEEISALFGQALLLTLEACHVRP